MQHSIVEYLSEHEGYRCGYCGSPDSNFSHGMWAHNLTCQDYQDLIDRGWRRSGKYVYKPTMDKMCCPQYTIRCHAPSLKLKKSQKKVLKRATKFFTTGEKPGGEGVVQHDGEDAPGGVHPMPPSHQELPQIPMEDISKIQGGVQESEGEARVAKGQSDVKGQLDVIVPSEHGGIEGERAGTSDESPATVSIEKQKRIPKPGLGADPTKPPCKKSKLLRLEKRQERLKQKANTESSEANIRPSNSSKHENSPKSLEEFIVDAIPGQDPKHRLEIRLIRTNPPSQEYINTEKESHKVYEKYQTFVHNDPPDECALFEYKRFLVDSPLVEQYSDDGPECGYGSFHQHYVLDGKIIAVGVIDILPTCVSSVYFYYDPEYRHLTLGTYSALRELAFTRLLNVTAPSLEYYYMGFYVHSCRKMRYKGQFYPSYLLCPEAYTFLPIEDCLPKLDVNKYSRFASENESDAAVSLEEVLVLHKHIAMPYPVYKQYRPQAADEEEVKEYAQMAGKKCVGQMLLYRN
ncbi:arginyl-tRNA--protein transferase 1-like isoform X2 [Lytechinus variegatus]|uniref:arginyl-tRNA--protein transferase 1-like isoform X2 n=1 Tax=Lytechinus variegatus TaxID=7654 RepID=UPI001BB19435|nr:arginyl-tRNA--protein transferase 1-like isoform X2 [Lytechinus variegatus]